MACHVRRETLARFALCSAPSRLIQPLLPLHNAHLSRSRVKLPPMRPIPLLLVALLPVAARAQSLPQPATSQATLGTPDPAPMLDSPIPSESPIIIGEPVRHQDAPLSSRPTSRVKRGSAAGISVSGLRDAAALDKINRALSPELRAPFRTVIGSYQYTFRREELGAVLALRPMLQGARRGEEMPLQLRVNRAKLEAALRELDGQVRGDFGDVGLDVPTSADKIEAALEASPPKAREALAIIRVQPASNSQTSGDRPDTAPQPGQTKLGKGAFPYLLASFSTKYDASLKGRTVNLRMAADHINGTVVPSGGVFSTNTAIGPRNAASGWREAKMFVSGRVVAGTGAGICQAASTLYNCALLGNFPILERHAHSMRVSYVPPSRDAALMWHQKDFKFRNTSGAPIRIETFVAGGKFNARVWGERPRTAPKVELVSLVTSREGGTHSTAFKLVGGQKVRLSSDFYRPHP